MFFRRFVPGTDDLFTGIKFLTQNVRLPGGGRRGGGGLAFELPQRYYDWEFMLASFPASTSAVRRHLPSPKLKPVELVPGTTLVSLGAFEYRKAKSLKPYNEVAIMFPVRCQPAFGVPALPLLLPTWFKDVGYYVLHLPVTMPDSCAAGVQIWNFPKVVA